MQTWLPAPGYARSPQVVSSIVSDSHVHAIGREADVALERAADRIVLVVEAVDLRFVERFRQFIEAADYEERVRQQTGRREYFRFVKPKTADYPFMLELFSRAPADLERLALTLNEDGGKDLAANIRTDLERFLAAFPDKAEDWPSIASALHSTMGAETRLSLADLRRAIASYFRLG